MIADVSFLDVAQQSSEPLLRLVDYGVIGIMLFIFIIFSRQQVKQTQERSDAEIKRERERADIALLEVQRLNDLFRETEEKLNPILFGATQAIQNSMTMMQHIQHAQEIELAERRGAEQRSLSRKKVD